MVVKLPDDDDVFILHCTSPLFDDITAMLAMWDVVMSKHDSMTAVYPEITFRLDEHYNPIGWSPGPWFRTSQNLPMTYRQTFCASITKRSTLATHAWYYGADPFYFHATSQPCDIDTEDDFAIAQRMYAAGREVFSNGTAS